MTRMASERLLIADKNPSSPASEAYKTLRTNIRFAALERPVKVLLITSATEGEGKTTTAANLAVTYAQENKKVLLVDGDLRTPSLQHVFARTSRKGLTDLLTGHLELEDVVSSTNVPNLSVLNSGQLPPSPSEILGSDQMRALLQELSELYDVVIIDTPPALSFSDAQILGSMSDGVVLVVHTGKVTKTEVRKVKAGMEHVNAKLLGAVLNYA
ncbi:CpsD/CapB family tyrosine-protein kinase [Paenibacillus sp. JX-17]|uniref:non-specific protein-tyrosine kinase n=1 Tax=Paenibacillus lacisoli TaxID=3064525 RepID=A0ABT9CLB5_9BACL|nr:CpsD/CapB family tyrosine-protein kinase [Paenibacillus sp. JX-17]MDO7908398.1 CpsD/CapB family tyrosine-protein kinase [Paenibacillus sp. JX-17]